MENFEPIAHLPFFVILLLLLAFARVFGELMERWGQPSMIGEILAGILLGPSLLNLIHLNSELKVFAEVGVFLLIIIAGMEIKVQDVLEGLKGKNLIISLFGFFLPLLSGFAIGYFLNLDIVETIFISLCISITALPVSVRILLDLGKLNTDVGKKIISVAIFNDVAALAILGIVLDVMKDGKTDITIIPITSILASVGITLLKVLLFMIVVISAFRIIDRLTRKKDYMRLKLDILVRKLKSKESFFAIMFIFILCFASLSELVGLHFIVGAFFGAMLLSHELLGKDNFEKMEKSTSNIAMGFLAPVFFATLGLEFEVSSLNNILLIVWVLVVSFSSKIFGGYFGSKLAGYSDRDSFSIGIGLNGRGIMELVIANIALTNGYISANTFSVLVLMGILTTLSTPLLLKKVFK